MMRPTRGLLAQVSVVLAIVALASIALAPRGMLRAAEAADLDAPVAASIGSPALAAPVDAVELPGVRALVSREEQDPQEALLEALTTGPVPGADLTALPSPSRAVDPADAPPPARTTASANRDRAPPSSI